MAGRVFISYRHESSDHALLVRQLGERLRARGLTVALDQFFLDDHPGGPDEGWPKWSSDQAKHAECVLIAASDGWISIWEGTHKADGGLGASWEATVIRQQIYSAKGVTKRHRLVRVSPFSEPVPEELRGPRMFKLDGDPTGSDFKDLTEWAAGLLEITPAEMAAASVLWPNPNSAFEPGFANRKKEWPQICDLLCGNSPERILLLEAPTAHGKTILLQTCGAYARALQLQEVYIDLDGYDEAAVRSQLALELELTKSDSLSILRRLRDKRSPVLLVFDTYQKASDEVQTWLSRMLLADIRSAPAVAVVVAGQRVPHVHPRWDGEARTITLGPITDDAAWIEWARSKLGVLSEEEIRVVVRAAQGIPGTICTLLPNLRRD